MFRTCFPSTLYTTRIFWRRIQKPLAPRVRWNAPEKSYPPRSRRAANEGLRFGKSAPFPYYPR